MKIPKIGTVVGVTWLDSGVVYMRDSKSNKELGVFTCFGKVGKVTSKSVVIIHEYDIDDKDDEGQQTISVIARKCIEEVVVYAK